MNNPHTLTEWATRNGVSTMVLTELVLLMTDQPQHVNAPRSTNGEAFVQSQVLLEAPRVGARLWRNNVGACEDKTGRIIRYGLANESKAQNQICKSSDLIGIKPILITHDMVGSTIGQFVAREVKRPGWSYKGVGREVPQLNYLQIVTALGGDAQFVTGEGSL
ncbi:MAG: hypothetical protein KAR42_11150 [candidate division Zixibacteria bacterium]|nr:hypothetical protein [candidate division Zixibacteria bacterium]